MSDVSIRRAGMDDVEAAQRLYAEMGWRPDDRFLTFTRTSER